VLPIVPQRLTFVDEKPALPRAVVEQHVVPPGQRGSADAQVVLDHRGVPAAADEDHGSNVVLVAWSTQEARRKHRALIEDRHLLAGGIGERRRFGEGIHLDVEGADQPAIDRRAVQRVVRHTKQAGRP
jgi:hypothetical protein